MRARVVPAAAVLAVVLASCGEQPSPTSVAAPNGVSRFPGPLSAVVSDGAHGGNPDFFFLPPLLPSPRKNPNFEPGTFNPNLAPTVKICYGRDLTPANECAHPLLKNGQPTVFTAVRGWDGLPDWVDPEQYHVLWQTRAYGLVADGKHTYRILVKVGSTLLGFLDLVPTNSLTGALRITAGGVDIGWLDDLVVPIRFRIQKGALCQEGANPGDCSETTVVGAASGTSGDTAKAIVVPSGYAALALPPGAVKPGDTVTVVIENEPPLYGSGDTAKCLPTSLAQSKGCWHFSSEPALYQFANPVRMEVCVDPQFLTTDQQARLRLYKYNTTQGLQQLPQADATLIQCSGFTTASAAAEPPNFASAALRGLGRFARRLLAPTPLFAAPYGTPPKGLGGLGGSFSDVGGAVPAAFKLGFIVQPRTTMSGEALTPAVQVAIQDSAGNTVTSASDSITIAADTLLISGDTTVAPVNGVATFSNLRMLGYNKLRTLTARATGLTGAVSDTFTVISFGWVTTAYWTTCAVATNTYTYCWGRNDGGQLGNGTITNSSTPVAVLGSHFFYFASAGYDHTCAVEQGQHVYCWGRNDQGQLGNNSTISSTTPVSVPGGNFWNVSSGERFSCGQATDGTVTCWGDNFFGQLGDGSTTSSTTPVPVSLPGGVTFAAGDWAIGSTGEGTGCVTTSTPVYGQMYCWGAGGFGQLGNGTVSGSTTPVLVSSPGGVTFDFVATGYQYTCGWKYGGPAYCWGSNNQGQLGIDPGVSTYVTTPQAVTTPTGGNFLSLSAGGQGHTCAVDISNTTYCWGANSRGELGNGTTVASFTPVLVSAPGGVTFNTVSAGSQHTCALTIYGGVYCWGDNAYGQLGNGTTTSSSTPVPISIH